MKSDKEYKDEEYKVAKCKERSTGCIRVQNLTTHMIKTADESYAAKQTITNKTNQLNEATFVADC